MKLNNHKICRIEGFKRIIKYGLIPILIGSYCFSTHSLEELNAQGENYISSRKLPSKSFVSIALEQNSAAIVTIESKRNITFKNINIFPPNLLIDPYFGDLFNIPNFETQKIEKHQGSGFIFSEKGFILTNAHVVENSNEIIIGISDGRKIKGKLIGLDTFTDIAVIELQENGPWPIAKIGNSDSIIVGDWAIAVGNPYGLEKTVTLGIISNLNRDVSELGIQDKRVSLIQTDAAINPGNSGGPLLNSNGEVIGMNTLIKTSPGAGLGFAIPINNAIDIANTLITKGKVIHPIIGINITSLETDLQAKNKVSGAKIISIIPNSPAEKKGLMIDDIIFKVNSKNVNNSKDVINEIAKNGLKKNLPISIMRNNKKIHFYIDPIDIKEIN